MKHKGILPPKCPRLIFLLNCNHSYHSDWWFQEHRTEIDARGGTFQAFELFGNQLLQTNHYASDDVRDKLDELAANRDALEK